MGGIAAIGKTDYEMVGAVLDGFAWLVGWFGVAGGTGNKQLRKSIENTWSWKGKIIQTSLWGEV